MKSKKLYALYLVLFSILSITGCMKNDDTQLISARLTDESESSIPSNEITHSDDTSIDEASEINELILEDDTNLIAEPGLEFYGTITSIDKEKHTITIESINYANNIDASKNSMIEHNLKITNDTHLSISQSGEVKDITQDTLYKNEMYKGAKVTYRFTIAATGNPILYSLTIMN